MKSIKAFFFGLLILPAASAIADTGKPESVGCDATSGVCFVNLESEVTTASCGNKKQLRIDPNLNGAKGMYTAALSALLGNKNIIFSQSGCFEGAMAPNHIGATQ